MKKLNHITRIIKESIRIINTEVEELKYIKMKYPDHYNIIDHSAWNSFLAGSVSLAMIKYSYGFN